MVDVGVYEIVAVVASFLIGLVASRQYYKKFKEVLYQVSKCIRVIDSAFEDDSLTKEEIKEIYEECIEPLKKIR